MLAVQNHSTQQIGVHTGGFQIEEFINLLRGHVGGELLGIYVQTSSKLSELLQAWNFQLGKPGLSYVLKLVSTILTHPEGLHNSNDAEGVANSRALDKFARSIFEEKLGDLYKELNSKEAKRQNAALLLLASIVRRGSGLASDVAKSFDFKLPIFPKLAEYKQKKNLDKKEAFNETSICGGCNVIFGSGEAGTAEMGPTAEGDVLWGPSRDW
ncbi:hypothetical protein Vadar_006404 [Vaccinium darrowii]|uniref:Uncharacterized protein n=1 Tax=Vaccinium darrowii TaxID=229202 RepID=A0ACB7ZIB3_9ERIC|nr:hypothetical protein Vadar_006404 [Vaccinium darrowii]